MPGHLKERVYALLCVVQVRDDWVVLANLTDSQQAETLVQLDLTSRETRPDREQGRVETSHWSRSIEILCSDWLKSWCCYASSLMP